MKKIGLHEIRREYLDFFKSKGHKIEESFSLVPHNDKSLLLIGAGMAPLKKYFTGELIPEYKRMATCQKCIRTGDIENVGRTARHATFFEMLGNFSFGDYFKKEAIAWAWEFLVDRMEFDPERLWATIYLDDDEAHDVWLNDIGMPEEKIIRLGKEDNFWELEVGPSGPDSEIFFDRGEKYGCGHADCKPGCDCDRFIEIWNLVFTQFDKDEQGNYNPLPNPNIDTGMGLERITCVLEEVDTIYDIRAMRDIIERIEEVTGKNYGENEKDDISIRVITDHVRAMTFMVSDGIVPGNESRGYVLRRIIRRAARHGRLLGIEDDFLSKVCEVVIDSWKVEYKNLETNRNDILRIIKTEENKFKETLNTGLEILDSYIEELEKEGKKVLDGEKAFKLYDTYGFPEDLTIDILSEKGMSVNEEEFEKLMEEQRNMARNARTGIESGWETQKLDISLLEDKDVLFTGYTLEEEESEVILLLKDDKEVKSLKSGEEGIIILKETPFYGESGGQVGDTGILSKDGVSANVLDTKKNKDKIFHIVKVGEGEISKGDKLFAKIDSRRRNAIRRNHTATHLLHMALRKVMGSHVKQAGSIVLPDRLRFDFTHFDSVSDEELKEIEKIVNEKIFLNTKVETIETKLSKAEEMGAIGLFEDKYKEDVRVLKIGDYSIELCGGTHVYNTSEIGMFFITSEGSVASGIRRIEAITGESVYKHLLKDEEMLDSLEKILKTNRIGLEDRVNNLNEELRKTEKELEKLQSKLSGSLADELVEKAEEISGVKLVVSKVEGMDMDNLRTLGDEIKGICKSCIVIVGTVANDKPAFVGMATKDVVTKGINMGNIIKNVAQVAGGGGGGRPDMAQAGGKDPSKLDDALKQGREMVKEILG
ncbi:MAG: alanine--tRNA ligase [Tissierellia bacterium]|nr:alanine--tRNA ligase [Tissierellia bacterium]